MCKTSSHQNFKIGGGGGGVTIPRKNNGKGGRTSDYTEKTSQICLRNTSWGVREGWTQENETRGGPLDPTRSPVSIKNSGHHSAFRNEHRSKLKQRRKGV